ncbi:MAG TPA: ABC-2 family transporter protein [Chloroflexota bacterium]|nr:ABC-2 family transporter protein [Chloroflexota bacterium]
MGGWSRGEAIVLLGTFQLISVLLNTFITPNLQWFGDQVKNGALDDVLLKPVSSLVLATLSRCQPLGMVHLALALATVVLGLWDLGLVPSMAAILGWLVLLAVGLVVTWAARVLVASVTLWFPSIGLDVVFSSFWQFARYPVSIYREPLPFILTYVVPVAFISTLPAQALTRGARLEHVFWGALVSLGAIVVVQFVWTSGLRRYTSATS